MSQRAQDLDADGKNIYNPIQQEKDQLNENFDNKI
jgi:hypothetical protein